MKFSYRNEILQNCYVFFLQIKDALTSNLLIMEEEKVATFLSA